MAQVALLRPDEQTKALQETVLSLLAMEEPRKRFAAMMSGLDIRYDFGEGHPLLGCRMPDLDLIAADGPVRVYKLLHAAKPVLLNLTDGADFDTSRWEGRIRSIDANYTGIWELPALGVVDAPSAVLIRPDGHVAWVGENSFSGLAEAIDAWF